MLWNITKAGSCFIPWRGNSLLQKLNHTPEAIECCKNGGPTNAQRSGYCCWLQVLPIHNIPKVTSMIICFERILLHAVVFVLDNNARICGIKVSLHSGFCNFAGSGNSHKTREALFRMVNSVPTDGHEASYIWDRLQTPLNSGCAHQRAISPRILHGVYVSRCEFAEIGVRDTRLSALDIIALRLLGINTENQMMLKIMSTWECPSWCREAYLILWLLTRPSFSSKHMPRLLLLWPTFSIPEFLHSSQT